MKHWNIIDINNVYDSVFVCHTFLLLVSICKKSHFCLNREVFLYKSKKGKLDKNRKKN